MTIFQGMGVFRDPSILTDLQANTSIYFIPSAYQGQDITNILQNALNSTLIGDVHIPPGKYYVSQTIVIPKNKTLYMAGKKVSYYLQASQVNLSIYTMIQPTFQNGFVFQMSDQSGIVGGFINCEVLSTSTSGGAIEIDCSQVNITRLNLLDVIMSGGHNWNLDGIFVNCDRPSGTNPGSGYFWTIDCGIQGFNNGFHFKRQDPYNTTSGTLTSVIVAVTGLRILGYMTTCQQYVFFDTSNGLDAGGSSYIAPVLEGGSVPNTGLPAIQITSDNIVLDATFFDIFNNGTSSGTQTVRYQIGSTCSSTAVMRYVTRGEADVIDNATDTVYLTDAKGHIYSAIASPILNSITVQDAWYTKNGNLVVLNLRVVSCPVYTGWTTIYNLPYTPSAQVRLQIPTDDTTPKFVQVLASTTGVLQVINNNTNTETFDIHLAYPTAN